VTSNRHRDFLTWSDRAERRLKQAVWCLAVLLLLAQTLLQYPAVRSWLTATERWEGVEFAPASR
jgi:hypothetical protein